MKFIIGFVMGIVVGQIGFGGMARVMDRGVNMVQQQAQEVVKQQGN
jgi:hypothetical protein